MAFDAAHVKAKPRAVGLLLADTSPSAPFGSIGAEDTVIIGAWIAGRARNDRCHAGLRSGIHAAPEQTPPQSRAWAGCSSRSGHVAWDGCFCGPAGCTRSRKADRILRS